MKISTITSVLVEASNNYVEILTDCITKSFDIKQNTQRIDKMHGYDIEFAKLLYDPEYVALLSYLNEKIGQKIILMVREIGTKNQEFLQVALIISETTDNSDPIFIELAEKANLASRHLLSLAKYFGEEFAKVDLKLSGV